jgi:glycosyltransferase involved in cell wall biosynthesis
MSIDVTVVIPTYNTGPKLEPLLASLAAQSLSADRYEVVAVDDGSADDTWVRLQDLATKVPNLRIERIPNSGWPGRPRNVGTDLARGRYVFYCDHDDVLFPEALERMAAMADRTEADVLIGKEVRTGAPTIGPELFLHDHDRADLLDDNVLALITPHKLFRTAFLREHGIRYPEGKRRLEDHVFLAQVYTKTDRIAVLASYPCYRWIIYPDGSNNSSSLGDLRVYFESLADVLTTLESADLPQERRDTLIQFWYSTRMLRRLSAFWFKDWEADYRDEAISIIGELAEKRVPTRLDEGLEPVVARRAELLRRGDHAGIVELASTDHKIRLRLDSSSFTWSSAGLRIDFSGTVVDRDDEPMLLHAHGDGLYFSDDPARKHDLRPFLARAGVDLYVRQQGVGTEWYADTPAPLMPRATEDGTVLEATASFLVDPTTFPFGRPLDDGHWFVHLHTRAFGYQSRARISGGAEGAAVLDGVPALAAPNKQGQLMLSVGSTPRFLTDASGNLQISGRGREAELTLSLPGLVSRAPGTAGFRLLVGDDAVEAELVPGSPAKLTALATVAPGIHEVRLAHGDRVSPVLGTLHAGRSWQRVGNRPGTLRRVRQRLFRRPGDEVSSPGAAE